MEHRHSEQRQSHKAPSLPSFARRPLPEAKPGARARVRGPKTAPVRETGQRNGSLVRGRFFSPSRRAVDSQALSYESGRALRRRRRTPDYSVSTPDAALHPTPKKHPFCSPNRRGRAFRQPASHPRRLARPGSGHDDSNHTRNPICLHHASIKQRTSYLITVYTQPYQCSATPARMP